MGYRLLAAICFGVLLSANCAAQDAPAKPLAALEKVIVGTVVDQAGKPVNGAEVGLQVWGFDEQDRLSESDFAATSFSSPDGAFQIPIPLDLDPKEKLGTVWVIAEGCIPSRSGSYGAVQGLIGRPQKLKVIPAQEVVVKVLDPGGRPAAGVQVKVVSQRLPQSIGFPIPPRWRESVAGTTNDRGEAWIEHALPDAIDGLVLSRKGFADVRLDGDFFLNVRPAKPGPTFTILFPDTGHLTGQLVDENGNGRPGIPLRIQTMGRVTERQLTAWGEADVKSDNDGRFRIEGIPAGRIVVPPFLKDEQPLRATIPIRRNVTAGETTNLVIPVTKGVRIRGQIRKGDTKEGVPGYRLGIIYGQSAAEHHTMLEKFQRTTDEKGEFTAVVPPGEIELRLNSRVEGYDDTDWWDPKRKGIWGKGVTVPHAPEFQIPPIDLDRSVALKGKLVDSDGEVLVDWSVYGYPRIPGKDEDSVMNSFPGVHTGRDGRFEGNHPASVPPAIWKVSYREWTTPFEFRDRKWTAKVIANDPLTLQVDVRKADLKDERKPKP